MSAVVSNSYLDGVERVMLDHLPAVHMPVGHVFTPGLYCRTITMPPGSLLTSKVHRTEHPYTITQGCVYVLVLGQEPELLCAGHRGITRPGTRRALFVPPDSEPCVWTTYHSLSEAEEAMRVTGATVDDLVSAIETRVIEPRLHADGTDAHAEYIQALAALGPPGPNAGAKALEGAVCLG